MPASSCRCWPNMLGMMVSLYAMPMQNGMVMGSHRPCGPVMSSICVSWICCLDEWAAANAKIAVNSRAAGRTGKRRRTMVGRWVGRGPQSEMSTGGRRPLAYRINSARFMVRGEPARRPKRETKGGTQASRGRRDRDENVMRKNAANNREPVRTRCDGADGRLTNDGE